MLPEFEFFRLNHLPFTNKDLPKDKKLFFLFFDTDCAHCHRALERINQQYQLFDKASVYLVSLNSPEKIVQTVKTYGRELARQKNVTLLVDKQNQFIDRFKPRRYPSMFLYAPSGALIDYEDNELTVFRILRFLKT
jgi:peroxiredoxin